MGAYFTLCSLIYILIFAFFFFAKGIVKNTETRTYRVLLITTIIGLLFDTLSAFMYMGNFDVNSMLYRFVVRVIFVYFLAWILSFTFYIYTISYNRSDKTPQQISFSLRKVYKIFLYTFFISGIISLLLPLEFILTNTSVYPSGLAVTFTYGVVGIAVIYIFVLAVKNYRSIINKKFTPLFALIISLGLSAVIQKLFPDLFLINFFLSIIVAIMYFTIENPDVKMIGELKKNRLLVESSIREKSAYLFRLSQEIKYPIEKLKYNLKSYKTSAKNEKERLFDDLEAEVKNLSFMVNNVIDVSKIDSSKIKLAHDEYNTILLFKGIEKKVRNEVSDDIELNFNVNNVPDKLYGDSIKLKQILLSILANSIEHTKKGFIDVNVNTIIRYDVCRLIITVKDSGCGMSIQKINDILSQDSNYTEDDYKTLNKTDIDFRGVIAIIKLLDGDINIKSEENIGTEVTVVVNQKISNKDNYLNSSDNKNVLLVDDNGEETIRIEKRLLNKNVTYNSIHFGKECIDRIKAGEKYNAIIINDEMYPDKALPILKELKKLNHFNIPVIVMLNKDKDKIKKYYLKDGFSDYILKEDLNNEISRICDKYF